MFSKNLQSVTVERPSNPVRWLFASEQGPRTILLARWLWLRALALIYFSAFFSLLFQVRGLIGEHGILPAGETLAAISQAAGHNRFWLAPSLFWLSSSTHFIVAVMWIGLIASVALLFNLWPRASLLICWICFLAFVSAAGDFSSYQSDGMLLEAGFISMFFAPPGLRPGLGREHPPIRLSLWLLRWERFLIYFKTVSARCTLYICGDRTVSNKKRTPAPPQRGWSRYLTCWSRRRAPARALSVRSQQAMQRM